MGGIGGLKLYTTVGGMEGLNLFKTVGGIGAIFGIEYGRNKRLNLYIILEGIWGLFTSMRGVEGLNCIQLREG